ncbi:7-carboxy-7-deazaguanine synthase QueE [Muricauda sp. SCSIO 64092]|uniref:7-carboxy-7-deazaguanine synthase QueE n=1 Tax=Allomuricauda sp. SCSIO 64092 TaxID=2908842 RepID=UPI001FF1C734|nr:7-carboxy-7-deazaguanine synthase QueE [Muricauda sp. SCSIO 64092]UOY05329.1 7-carboxy-7-deazaguanine synthase QueE [Muricauda sp. SCSIO 64092]
MKISKNNGIPEIFHSLQGEGKSIGRPSIFIRTSLCNLHCIWCDTDYTWNWKNTNFKHKSDSKEGYSKFSKENQIIELDTSEIVSIVLGFNCNSIVLTGGEPLIQQFGLVKVMQVLREKSMDYHFEVETNGTIMPTREADALIDQYNVSPKLKNSCITESLRIKPEPLGFFSKSPKANFKFVVSDKGDIEEILALMTTHGIDPNSIYLMSEGTSMDELSEKNNWLVEICKTYNFHFTNRLHVFIWGSKRGI